MNEYDANPGGGNGSYRPDEEPQDQKRRGYYPPQGSWPPDDRTVPPAQPTQTEGYSYTTQPPRVQESPYTYNYAEYAAANGAVGEKKPPKKNKKGLAVFAVLLGSLAAVMLLSFTGYGFYVMMTDNNFLYGEGSTQTAPEMQEPGASPRLDIVEPPNATDTAWNDGGLSNEAIAQKVLPSVVGIANFQASTAYGIAGEGTGIIMNQAGYIVTNEHVVQGADGIQVTLSNGESYNARLVGGDTATDLAVIKLESDTMPMLTAAEFGDSASLKVGERVVAIGNAGGSEFTGTTTGGMVSGLNRQINTESGNQLSVIQTDAAINPGNSGGPLINRFGQVVGINSAKYTQTNFEGIGFAIPINNAKPIVDDLIQNGRVTGRPRLGITGQPMTSVLAQYRGYPRGVSGVLVVSVDPSCDIYKQGVVAGDVLMTMNDTEIESMTWLRNEIIKMKPGDQVAFEIYRPASQRGTSGKTLKILVTLDADDGTSNFPEQQEQPPEDQENQGGILPEFPYFPFY